MCVNFNLQPTNELEIIENKRDTALIQMWVIY